MSYELDIKFDETHKKPYLVCEWNDNQSTARGWVVVYNFVNNFCSGGTRMHPSVTPEEVYRLARAMSYKYKACESVTTGGCKAGISYDSKAADARDVLKRFMIAMAPLMKSGVNLGGDLGVDANEVFKIWDEINLPVPITKAMRTDPKVIQGNKNHDEMCSMKLDCFTTYDFITGYGVADGADELWTLRTGKSGGGRVVIQGFGCLGVSCAYRLVKMGYKITGISDVHGLVFCEDGLDIQMLMDTRKVLGEMNREALPANYKQLPGAAWLEQDCDILIPAALEDVLNASNADKVKAQIIVEGANICTTPEADEIFHKKGIDIAVDFTVNLGATRYYDSVFFQVVGKNTQEACDDVEKIIRKDIKLVYEASKKSGKKPREVAEEIFAPDTFDNPDI